MSDVARLDRFYKPCGPCAFCGFHDKRHRLWDVWLDMASAGESAKAIAEDYDVSLEHVEAVLGAKPYQEPDATTATKAAQALATLSGKGEP